MCDKLRKYEQLKMQFYLDCVDFDKPDNKPYIYIYIYIYVWKLNQTVLELDFRAVKYIYIQIPSMLLMLKIITFIMKNTHEKS